jgi:hypothetical protein
MFGMLDYRAHKLFWLITLPFRLLWRLLWLAAIAAGVWIGLWTGYPVIAQIIIGYVAMEGIALIASLVLILLITWPLESIFFWLIDVVPSRGEDVEEAKEIVRRGPIVWLMKKLLNHIDDWTYQDSHDFVKQLNWRARALFNEREQFLKRVDVLYQFHEETGKQPGELPEAELNKLLKPYKMGWFETAIVNPYVWNSILSAIILACAILYLAR